MAEPRQAFLARRRQELFVDLKEVHDLLTDYQDEHNAGQFGCQRSGKCCQVGLQLHMMECDYIADHILGMADGDADQLEDWVDRLKNAFEDKAWTWKESIGDHWCAFFEDGCSIYPFRPSVCRMYGVVLEVDDHCPRTRLANGDSYVYVQKDVDRLIAKYYHALDVYGRLHPKRDYTVYMPAGVLTFLMPADELKAFKAKTDKKFWRRQKGYRTQFVPSYKQKKALQTNVSFPFAVPTK